MKCGSLMTNARVEDEEADGVLRGVEAEVRRRRPGEREEEAACSPPTSRNSPRDADHPRASGRSTGRTCAASVTLSTAIIRTANSLEQRRLPWPGALAQVDVLRCPACGADVPLGARPAWPRGPSRGARIAGRPCRSPSPHRELRRVQREDETARRRAQALFSTLDSPPWLVTRVLAAVFD